MQGVPRPVSRISLIVVAGLVVVALGLAAQAARGVTLDVGVLLPPLPVTESDSIVLRALTSQEVLPDTTWHTYTSSLVIDSFDIRWELTSASAGGIGLQIIIPVAKVEMIGPLPAGTYNVTATWVGEAPIWSQHLLPLVGTTQFTVVPEPAAAAVLTATVGLRVLRRRP